MGTNIYNNYFQLDTIAVVNVFFKKTVQATYLTQFPEKRDVALRQGIDAMEMLSMSQCLKHVLIHANFDWLQQSGDITGAPTGY